jgi:hypothetical protein
MLTAENSLMVQINSRDHQRLASRKGARYQVTLNILALLLPGATISFYGDEIGLDDTHLVDSPVLHSSVVKIHRVIDI